MCRAVVCHSVHLSHRLDARTQIYPGDPAFSCCPTLTLAVDGVNVQSVSLGSHTGTHVDAPFHFFDSGARIDEIPLSRFVGRALVIDVTGKAPRERILWAALEPYEEEIRRRVAQASERGTGLVLLFHTGWSRFWGAQQYLDHPFLDAEVAKRIVDLGVTTFGIDTLSPDETPASEKVHTAFDVHKVFLGAGGVIAENVTNLEKIRLGEWDVSMVPLKLGDCDGSPVRAYASRQVQL
ncbi:putative cyclase [Wolfiporia cocos MD-104 SS10]|uniref:Putative cyclase n=1 Tax=Wolfiporia cocos (strain MD-104) TaxID=742152 RepID=A0A2H3JDG6_WOLCO|nr:putative cyclase [Wolfiporia cocos MD-104 SS10]